jgi:hypothetical protein
LYQELVKLYFSCLGHPSAGKTMWMAMAYRELTEGRYPDALQFMQPKFLGSDVWDGLADQIVNERICPGATPSADIPDPLVFSFLDGDWARRSNVHVELSTGRLSASAGVENTRLSVIPGSHSGFPLSVK